MSVADVDPYGGLRETWTVADLNSASQGAGVVFDAPAVRQMPATNQILVPSVSHLECCGPCALVSAASAIGLIALADVVSTIVDCCNFLGAASVAQSGTGTRQLLSYAQHRGWPVHEDDRKAGDLAVALTASGHIGISALDTAYGTGAAWNTLHPQAGGRIGHWEGFGAVDGPVTQEYDMNPAIEVTLQELSAWELVWSILGRPVDAPSFQSVLGQVRSQGYSPALWALITPAPAGQPPTEFQQYGGLMGRLARIEAQQAVLAKTQLSDEQAAAVERAGDAAVKAIVDQHSAAISAMQAHLAATTTVTTSSTTTAKVSG